MMGVSSSGKSTIGEKMARRLGAKFIDGDDLHPKANILKMASGSPLNDADRAPWLERIRDAAFSLEKKSEQGVIVCSALKRAYRDQIREGNQQVRFILLRGDFELILERMLARSDHFMPPELLKSQFEALEPPTDETHDVLEVDIDGPIERVVERCLQAAEQFKQTENGELAKG
ncbi:gluconokinase [Dongshaea marina]|uniref:gluconokinase n=1 Tax=Dongshaea marina TaxID=2047966 RepID=UPI000D3ECBCB|nr:gluconokinase [Dongshaea marina]